MNAAKWREAGYRVMFRGARDGGPQGDRTKVFLIGRDGVHTTNVEGGRWMDFDDLTRPPWIFTDKDAVDPALVDDIKRTAEACYCGQAGVGLCDFCAGTRTVSPEEAATARRQAEESQQRQQELARQQSEREEQERRTREEEERRATGETEEERAARAEREAAAGAEEQRTAAARGEEPTEAGVAHDDASEDPHDEHARRRHGRKHR